jgi:hypothetical protein
MTPETLQGAAFGKERRPYAGTVVNGKTLGIQQYSFDLFHHSATFSARLM